MTKAEQNKIDHIDILRSHNEWRRGAEMPMTDTRALGIAIQAVIAELEMRRRGVCICIKCGFRNDGDKNV